MKLYVITPYEGKTDEEILEYREGIRDIVDEVLDEDIELVLPTPGLRRMASEVDGVLKADIVYSDSKAKYSLPCRLVEQVALCYNISVNGEDWVEGRRAAIAELEAERSEIAFDEQVESTESQESAESSEVISA